jgi:hypothetical protein
MQFPQPVQESVDATRALTALQPQLALNHAWQLDQRLLREGWKVPTTVAAHGTAAPGWNSDAGAADWRNAAPVSFSALATGSRLVAQERALDGAAWVWEHSRGQEIPALNLMYANQALAVESMWLHFLNKYLAYFAGEDGKAVSVGLLRSGTTRFDRLTAGESPPPSCSDGPLITVLMPVYNARATLRKAVQSILDQTWKRLELILLDDRSTDDSLAIARELARQDPRIRVVALEENRGPYVAKNIGLRRAKGDYVTVHDADDWAFPTRLADQIAPLLAQAGGTLKVTMGLTLRMDKAGRFTRFQPLSWVTEDGAMRWCFPSPLFERRYFEDKLGAWDSVRVGADAEIVQRIRRFEPEAIQVMNCPVMIQLDEEGSLTRSEEFFNDQRGESPARQAYRESWMALHAKSNSLPKKVRQ